MNQEEYEAFLRAKVPPSHSMGFDVTISDFSPVLKPHQRAIAQWMVQGGRRACFASFGLGKCHGAGTEILMADGSIKQVEDVEVGDRLMGDDSTPRTVLSLARGREPLYRITLKNGDSYTCNESHVFSLRLSNKYREHQMGTVVDMPLRDWQKLPGYAKSNCFKHYKTAVEFTESSVPFDPYLYGAWLGDGHVGSLTWTINDHDPEIVDRIRSFAASVGLSVRMDPGRGCADYHVTQGHAGKTRQCEEFYFVQDSRDPNGKRIDRRYLTNGRTVRLALLAGLIDTDGYLGGGCYEIATKWEGLRDDILFLCRSLGLSVHHRPKVVNAVTYWVVIISGHLDAIPCITRKKASPRQQIKTPLVYGFTVEAIGEGDYFGFVIDGNHRYLLADFTVTHNTLIQLEACRVAREQTGGLALITCPLGVRQEFARDAEMVGIRTKFIRRIDEVEDESTIHLTNYETIRDGKLDPRLFSVTSLDECSVLRGFGGTKTFREFMRLFADDNGGTGQMGGGVRIRFLATATPSPNEYIELLAYAAYLGIMDIGAAKTRWFKRDSEKADHLTLRRAKEREFWLWLASWGLFCQRPSDLGPEYSDEGYELPPMEVHWHQLPTDHTTARPRGDGQGRLFRDTAISIQNAAAEKRDSLDDRIAKLLELRALEPDAHRIIWHDLEAERVAIERAIPGITTVYGSQDLDSREEAVIGFSDGVIHELAGKPVMLGSGCNFQRYCAWEIFLGIGFKFNDFIQAIYRVQRFLQPQPVRIDLIYTEAEERVRSILETKWTQHNNMVDKMTDIIREYGLGQASLAHAATRTMGLERVEVSGNGYRLVNADTIEETARMEADSVDLIITSPPFSTQYEYSPSYNDLGHTDDDEHFFRHLDFLTPELLRVLKPGRVAAIHVKDRIVPGGITGLGFQTVSPFSDMTITHFRQHGFAFLGRKTIVTDVVRENNQTYRLGWTEQCKDGSRMGVGMCEYLLLFRKPPTDLSNGYADTPVVKSKDRYTRSRWQIDAHGFARSSGNRPLLPEELATWPHERIFKLWRDYSLQNVYDFEYHVKLGENLERLQRLPVTFMLLQPPSWHPDVWTDVARMRTLNMQQERKGQEHHLCPIQFDIVDRCIEQFSQRGEVVFDPFGGLMTVPYCALKLGRHGIGIELSPTYFRDGAAYCEAASRQYAMPSLFDLLEPAEVGLLDNLPPASPELAEAMAS